MRHTPPREAVSTTRRRGSRISRLLAVMISLCLALSLSLIVPALTHQVHQAHAATCTSTHTMTFTSAQGNVTSFSNNSLLPGPDTSQSQVVVTVHLDSSSPQNICSFSLNAPFKVKDPNGNTAEIKSLNPSTVTSPGTWNSSTGALTFDGTVTLDMLPLLQGSFTTMDNTLSTENSVTTNGGTVLTGARCNAQHVCTLVGATSFNAGGFVGTVKVWLEAVGTFQ